MSKRRKDNTIHVINNPENYILFMMKRNKWGTTATIDQDFFEEISRKYKRDSTFMNLLLSFLSFPRGFGYSRRELWAHHSINSFFSVYLLPDKSHRFAEFLKDRECKTKEADPGEISYYSDKTLQFGLLSQRHRYFSSNYGVPRITHSNNYRILPQSGNSHTIEIYKRLRHFFDYNCAKAFIVSHPWSLEHSRLHDNFIYGKSNTIEANLHFLQTLAKSYSYHCLHHTERRDKSQVVIATRLESASFLTLPTLYGKSVEEERYQNKKATSANRIGPYIKPGMARTYIDIYSKTLNRFSGDVLSRFTHERDVVSRTVLSEEFHMKEVSLLKATPSLTLPLVYGESVQKAKERQRYQSRKESTRVKKFETIIKPDITNSCFNVYSKTLNKFSGDVLSRLTQERNVVSRTERSGGFHVKKESQLKTTPSLILSLVYGKSIQKAKERQRHQNREESTCIKEFGTIIKPDITGSYFDVYSGTFNKFTGEVFRRFNNKKEIMKRTERSGRFHVKKEPQLKTTPSLTLPLVYGKSIQKAKERQRHQNREESTCIKEFGTIIKPDITGSYFDVYSGTFNKYTGEVFRRFNNKKEIEKHTEQSKEPHVAKAKKATSDLQLKSSKLYNIPMLKGKTIQLAIKKKGEISGKDENITTINRVKGFYLKKRSIDNKTQMDVLDHNLTQVKQIAMLRKGYLSKSMNEELKYNMVSMENGRAFFSKDSETYKNSSNLRFMKKNNLGADGSSASVSGQNLSDMIYYASSRASKSSDTIQKEKVGKNTGYRDLGSSYKADIGKSVLDQDINYNGMAEKVYGIILKKIERELEMRGR